MNITKLSALAVMAGTYLVGINNPNSTVGWGLKNVSPAKMVPLMPDSSFKPTHPSIYHAHSAQTRIQNEFGGDPPMIKILGLLKEKLNKYAVDAPYSKTVKKETKHYFDKLVSKLTPSIDALQLGVYSRILVVLDDQRKNNQFSLIREIKEELASEIKTLEHRSSPQELMKKYNRTPANKH
jgi:hypothetical protein